MVAAYKGFTIQLGYIIYCEQRHRDLCIEDWERTNKAKKEKELEVQETAWKMMYKYYKHDMVHLGTMICSLWLECNLNEEVANEEAG